jgi:hypothetical protein
MKNNKIIILAIIFIVLTLIIGVVFIFLTKKSTIKNDDFINNMQSSLSCAEEGETIGASGMPKSCCSNLKPLGGMPNGYDGDCTKLQPPTGLSICANCGDGICNSNYEGKCNCPADCAKSKCGKEGETLDGDIDRCCQGLRPKSLSDGGFGGLFECTK